jgi:2-polyprenyl-6-hydroxyphenyl methylase/3-demethylubiquinone-9 3-methyltransferase
MPAAGNISGYRYSDAHANHSHAYLLPTVTRIVEAFVREHNRERRLFDLGCGNGYVAAYFADRGFQVAGVDPSQEGIAQARASYPELDLYQGSAYDDLRARYGTFPVVISLEVVEHVYSPREYARTVYDLLEDGGAAVISTPYHGYFKNLAIALTNSFDRHVKPLWDHGHIKFWSMATLRQLLTEVGFTSISFHRVGRVPILAKSMIAVATKPGPR